MSRRFGAAFDGLPLVKRSQNSKLMQQFGGLKHSLTPGEQNTYTLELDKATQPNPASITRYVDSLMLV